MLKDEYQGSRYMVCVDHELRVIGSSNTERNSRDGSRRQRPDSVAADWFLRKRQAKNQSIVGLNSLMLS
ncbi:MAG: hypothetical protein LUO94_05175 [Methylococcaceae bacterium]|jgi:hypothetical protein|nr:hypothetical protein [Methylococcaceae bacterium]MDD1641935.1 hypothetical protein [Methylococcaceae bacterium]